MLSKFSFASLLILFLTKSILAQDSLLYIYVFPSAKEVSFNLACSVKQVNDSYEYNYSIKSFSGSQQDICRFMVEVISNVTKVNSPINWSGGYYLTSKKTVNWNTIDSTFRVQPGETLNGFSFSCSGLPDINNSFTRGYVYNPPVSDEPDSVVGNNIFENSVIKRTIAPKTIPNPFEPLAFIDNLISMGDEADSLKWIMGLPYNDYLLWPNLKTKLNNTYDYIDNSNYRKAEQELDSFLTAVEDYFKGRPQFITSEGYALMKYNGEYLLQWLTEERKN